MMRAAAAAVIVLLSVGLVAPDARGPRLADATLPKTPALFLEIPVSDASTFDLLQRVLLAANVPFGLESAAPPSGGFPRRPTTVDRTVRLNGQKLSSALDAIVAADPHYKWAESDGRLLVRGVAGDQSWLGRKVPHIALANAPPRGALQALLSALDPDRKQDQGLDGMSPMPPTPSNRGHDVTLRSDNGTVLSILNAIAHENGAVSWTVQYDDAPATYENATLSLVTPTEKVTAISPHAMRTWSDAMHDPLAGPPPGFMRLAATGEIWSMAVRYARSVHVRVNGELLPPAVAQPTAGALTLDVPTSDPAAAIAAIVALDDRYQVSQRANVFLVAPKAEAASRSSLLERSVGSFSAAGEPIASVLQRIAWLMGGQPSGTGAELGNGPWPGANVQQRFAALRATPITVSLTRKSTIREVLDAICDAEGTLSWQLQPRRASEFLEVTLSSFNGWGLTQSFKLSTGGMAASGASAPKPAPQVSGDRTPVVAAVRIPSSLDRAVDLAMISINPRAPGQAFATFGALSHVPMGVEVAPGPPWPKPDPDPRVQTQAQPITTFPAGPGRASGALSVIQSHVPGYSISTKNGVISVAPDSLLRERNHFMDVPIGRFEVHDISIYRAVAHLRHYFNPEYEERDWPDPHGGTGPADPERLAATKRLADRHVTLSLDHATPREILDRLIAQHGELGWTATYQAKSLYDQAQPIESDCIISLAPFRDVGVGLIFAPIRPSVQVAPSMVRSNPTAPPPRPVPPRPAGARVIRLPLPATTAGLRSVLSGLGISNHVPFGWEVIEPPGAPVSGNPSPGGDFYDLTGLAIPQALDKLVGFLPAYTWTLDAGVYHVRPKSFQQNRAVALNRRVDRVEMSVTNVDSALAEVHRLLDPGFAIRPSDRTIPDRLKGIIDKPMAISLRDVAVRDVLDEIVRQNGNASWRAVYADASGAYPQLLLEILGFDGWGVQMPAHIK
jgi:hypothetical protein